MAFAVDQATLASGNPGNVAATSFPITTSGAVAASGLIVVAFGWFGSGAVTNPAVSGGGLTWTTAISIGLSANSDGCALAWAPAPSGLASGTVLTVGNGTANAMGAPDAVAMSWTGAASSGIQGGTGSGSTTANPWSGGSVTSTGTDSLIVGCGWGDGNAAASTDSTSGIWSQGPTNSQGGGAGGATTIVYTMGATAGIYIPAGTWATSIPSSTQITSVAFKAADSLTSPYPTQTLTLMGRMTPRA